MRERLGGLIGTYARGMWVSTFHSMCVRILRTDCERIGFAKGFTIADPTDTKRLIKQILDELNIDPKRYPERMMQNRISMAKNDLVVAQVFSDQANDFISQTVAKVYLRYQERLQAQNAFDFDDLLLYTWLLLKNHPDVLEAYQNRFRYLLVDEYQDTNHAQYVLTQLLAAKNRNIMVVGDDDQSIYSWRGADLRNILDFEEDYPDAQVVKLEENYRSVGNILSAANAVIANNVNRKSKKHFSPLQRMATRSKSIWLTMSAMRAAGLRVKLKSSKMPARPITRWRCFIARTRNHVRLKTCFCAPVCRIDWLVVRAF